MLTAAIVENNISFREMLKSGLLSQFPSVEVLEAGDGEELFEKFAFSPVDLIFMDIRLPGQNGLELTKKIKTSSPDIIIIIFTGYDLPEYREAATRNGADYFFPKDSTAIRDIFAVVESISPRRLHR